MQTVKLGFLNRGITEACADIQRNLPSAPRAKAAAIKKIIRHIETGRAFDLSTRRYQPDLFIVEATASKSLRKLIDGLCDG
jgi:hypothetical protein